MKIDKKKILICDDSILARKQLKDIISKAGTPIFLEAADGQEAVRCYKEQQPDLVFLDIVMPNKDGNVAIAEMIRTPRSVLRLPLVLRLSFVLQFLPAPKTSFRNL